MGGSVESVLFMDMYKRHRVGQTLLQLFLLPTNSILAFLYFSERSIFTIKIYSSPFLFPAQ